jgi:hypothetical protein
MKKWAHVLNRTFSREEVQMASKYMKKYSTSLVIKEIEIKTIPTFHLTPVKMAIINGNNNNKCWPNRNPFIILVGMQIRTTSMESSMTTPQKTRDRTAIRSSDIAPGHLAKGT